MKKIISLVLAIAMTAVIFAGCARKAEMQTLDPVKVTSVTTANGPAEDKNAIVEAYNAAAVGNVIKGTDYQVGTPLVIVTTDGVVEVFSQGGDKYAVHSGMFDYAFEITSADLAQYFTAE